VQNKKVGMKLQEYFDERKTNLKRFCDTKNLSYYNVRRILMGQEPTLTQALAIEKATGGKVKSYELLSEEKKGEYQRLRRLKVGKRNIKKESESTKCHEAKDDKERLISEA
jgi:hypothetical protein